ncbi:protein of unknown function [Lachnospiraceae bacterium C10]|nr:DUF4358 domain-containing protein [Lachnospiraceae bacterium]SCW70566.1 protein of unknown function [Lachnospiraceae bacterium C10]SDW28173.1 protein of unknown function [Lachnospiraceae bacterium KHCPX20]
MRHSMRRRCTSLLLVLSLAATAFTGCSGKSKSVDAIRVGKAMQKEATTFPELKVITSKDKDADLNFTALCNYDYDRVESYYYAYAKDGSASEIAVISLKDASDASSLMSSLKDHVKTRQGTMQEYSPEQVDMVEAYLLKHQKNAVTLVIGPQNGIVEKVFEKEVKGE